MQLFPCFVCCLLKNTYLCNLKIRPVIDIVIIDFYNNKDYEMEI